jgi:L-seryl-tRNA(Ser) seleniumtransferase
MTMIVMDNKNQIMRNIPQVEKLLQIKEIACFIPEIGRAFVVDIIRSVLEEIRSNAGEDGSCDLQGIVHSIVVRCSSKRLFKLQRVINGTGVVVHTNLGRSPISEDLLIRLAGSMSGYCNLEFDLTDEKRGRRGGFAEELLSWATGAQDSLVVNNNASSVFLILREFGRGREVIVSRGELIQIGGGFRLPDIMRESGAILVEAGTTNVTSLDDFRSAITGNTAMIFSSHLSNFRMHGFTSAPTLRELSALKNKSMLLVRDLGSGNLVSNPQLPGDFDPTVGSELERGADLVCFSGDKLLGGCQAGIIAGREDLVMKLRKNPLMRMLRVDKLTYYILQETLLKSINGEESDITLWKLLFQDDGELSGRMKRFIRMMKNSEALKFISRVRTRGVIGGGAMPGYERESHGIQIQVPGRKADEIFSDFISAAVPVIGSIRDDSYTIDFFTILDEDIPLLARAVDEVITRHTRNG